MDIKQFMSPKAKLKDLEEEENKITEPPKKWKNWFIAKKDFNATDSYNKTNFLLTGQKWCWKEVYVSKDLAETHFQKVINNIKDFAVVQGFAEYLGAFQKMVKKEQDIKKFKGSGERVSTYNPWWSSSG